MAMRIISTNTDTTPAPAPSEWMQNLARAGFEFGSYNQGGKGPAAAAAQDSTMMQTRIVSPVTPVRVARDGDCSVPVSRAEWNALVSQLGPQGPTASGYNAIFGTGAGFSSDNPYKGGPIATDVVAVSDVAAANTVIPLEFSALNRARLTGTWMLRVGAIVQPGTAAGGQLAAQSYSATLTARINGFPVAQMSQIPLGSILPNLVGTPQDFTVPVMIPADAVVDFELRILAPLNGTPGETSVIQLLGTFGQPSGALQMQAAQLGYRSAAGGNGCW